jgi:uncharacterized protein (DUF697 family)
MSDRDLAATELVKKYSVYAAAGGLIPAPWVDMAAITAINLKMLSDLGNVYGLKFEQDRVRPILGSLIAGAAATKLGYGIGGSMLKAIPLVGSVAGMIAMPAFASAVTFAVGKVFIQHFASGGTFLDFDPDKVRAYFNSSASKAA